MQLPRANKRRIAILAASYLSLAAIGYIAYVTVQFYVGALSVIPILFISYYVRPAAAIATAVAAGIIIAALNADLVPYGDLVNVPPALDIVVLSLVLAAIVIVARRLRETSTANEALRGSLVRARRAAERDSLTGIANRRYFVQRLDKAIEELADDEHTALLFCDLDGFKNVNDHDGHVAGDQVLRMAASRLVNSLRAADVVARIGGDEFAVLARSVRDAEEAAHMAKNLEHAFNDPFRTGGKIYTIGITVGIAMMPGDGTDAEQLLRVADARMYEAKQAKRTSRGTVTYGAAGGTVSGEAAPLPRPDA